MTIWKRIAAAAACAVFSIGLGMAAAATAAAPDPNAGRANWLTTYTIDAVGDHAIGNPHAKVHLTEFVSYTCPHCAHFFAESDVALRIGYIQPGKVLVSINNVIRNPVDLAVARLTECGDPNQFFRRHRVFMSSQATWMARGEGASKSQQERWYNGPEPERMRAIASDFDLYAVVSQFGITRPQADRCLADPRIRARIAAQQAHTQKMGVEVTPSFAIGDELRKDIYDWPSLQTELMKQVSPIIPVS